MTHSRTVNLWIEQAGRVFIAKRFGPGVVELISADTPTLGPAVLCAKIESDPTDRRNVTITHQLGRTVGYE